MIIPNFISEYINKCKTKTNCLHSGRLKSNLTVEINDWFIENNTNPIDVKYMLEHNIYDYPNCPVCGNKMKFGNITCSSKCSANYSVKREKIKQTCLDKYGVENPSQINEIKKKKEETCLKHFGVRYSWQSEEIKEKIKQTNLEKYGVENPNQSQEIREKTEKTCLDRYRTRTPFQSEEIKEKIKQTNLEKYGVENPSQSNEIKQKKIETSILHYGFENPTQSEIVKTKMKKTCIEKYGSEYYTQTDEYKERLHNICQEKYGCDWPGQIEDKKINSTITHRTRFYDTFVKLLQNKNISLESSKEDFINENNITVKCLKCGNLFTIKYTHPQKIYCQNCFKQPYSKKEKEVVEWIQSIYSGNIIENDREILNGKELDIYIPDKKLAIEFDGNYWHSAKIKEKEYHQEKTLACIEKGIKLIHIFEYDWDFNQEIIKSIVKSAFGIYDKRIYARKCIAKEISTDDYKNFLDINHLQCSINSSIRYGLYHQNELVSVIGFGKSRFKKDEIELHRFCCKLNYHIPGAFSKLIKHSGIDNFITYVDLAHFTGDGYKKIGFKELSVTEPNYKWISDDGTIVLNRFQTQKHKLAKLLKNYDKNLTEAENMELNCYFRIFDSGNLKLKY